MNLRHLWINNLIFVFPENFSHVQVIGVGGGGNRDDYASVPLKDQKRVGGLNVHRAVLAGQLEGLMGPQQNLWKCDEKKNMKLF